MNKKEILEKLKANQSDVERILEPMTKKYGKNIDDWQPEKPEVKKASTEGIRSYFNPATGKESRVYDSNADWSAGQNYDLPGGLKPEDCSFGRMLRAHILGDRRNLNEMEERALSVGQMAGGGLEIVPLNSNV